MSSRFKKTGFLLILFVLALQPIWQLPSAHAGNPRKMHDKLFDCFLPAPERHLSKELVELVSEARESIWNFIKQNEKIISLYGVVDTFTPKKLNPKSCINALNKARRVPGFSQSATQLKYLYSAKIYGGELGKRIAGETQDRPLCNRPEVHPDLDGWIQKFQTEHLARFPNPNDVVQYHEQAKKLTPAKKEKFDYVVIGSGPAGSVLGHELRSRGKKVLLIERGPFLIPGAKDGVRQGELLESRGIRATTNGGILIRNANTFGGGTAVNIDLAFSPLLESVQNQIKSWRDAHVIGQNQWNRSEIEKAYDWVKRTMHTRPVAEDEMNKNNRILWDGSLALDSKYPASRYDLNAYMMGDENAKVSVKKSSVSQLLLNAMEDHENPLAVLTDTEVLKLEWSGNQVTSIKVIQKQMDPKKGYIQDLYSIPKNQEFEVHADRFILAAGSLGSATVLLKSKLDTLNENVGRGMVLHPSIPIIGQFNTEVHILQGLPASVYNAQWATHPDGGFILESMSAGPEYGAMMLNLGGAELLTAIQNFKNFGGFGVMLIDKSSTENRVILDEKNEPQVDYTLSAEGKRRMRNGIKKAIEILFAAGADSVAIPTVENLPAQANMLRYAFPYETKGFYKRKDMKEVLSLIDHLEFKPGQTTLTSAHMQATNQMGKVVDYNHRFMGDEKHRNQGIDNLYIVDGSVFPGSIGANPMQSIYTIAKIFCDKMEPAIVPAAVGAGY